MKWLILFLAAALLLIAALGGFVFFSACKRKRETDWLNEEALKKTSYAKYGSMIKEADAWLNLHAERDVMIRSHDGLLLHALWIPAQNPRGTVLLAHGYRSTRLVDFGLAFELYHDLGMNILVPEQRSHGNSEGKYITFGVKESRDMADWIRYHNENLSRCPIVLSGLSMGASTVLYLADEELPSNVRGIIADCGFTSPAAIIRKVYRSTTHLPGGPVIAAADVFAKIFAGFSLREKDSRQTLRDSRLPILLIHGERDKFVPCEMTREAYDACTGPKQLLTVKEAGHGLSFLHAREEYTRLIMEFLDTNIGERK